MTDLATVATTRPPEFLTRLQDERNRLHARSYAQGHAAVEVVADIERRGYLAALCGHAYSRIAMGETASRDTAPLHYERLQRLMALMAALSQDARRRTGSLAKITFTPSQEKALALRYQRLDPQTLAWARELLATPAQ